VKSSVKHSLFILIVSLGISCSPKLTENSELLKFDRILTEAADYYNVRQYDKAINSINQITRMKNFPEELKMQRPGIYYNQACNYALNGNKQNALDCLQKAVNYGYANYRHIEKDSDLNLIKNEKIYRDIIHTLKLESKLWDNSAINTSYKTDISDREKIAGLSKLWSEIKFNFVNFDIIDDINPDSLYMAYLPKVLETNSTIEYYWCLKEFCTHMKDGHTDVIFPKEIRDQINGRLPLQSRLIEGKVIITDIYDDALKKEGIAPGDEILEINDLKVHDYADSRIRPYWTNNSKHGLNRTIYEYALFRGPVGDTVRIKIKDPSGKIFSYAMKRQRYFKAMYKAPVVYKQLENNVGYLAINTFAYNKVKEDFDSVFNYIIRNDALIIDLRENGGGNGRIGWAVLAGFTDKPFKIFKWKTRLYRPVWRAWGRKEETYVEEPALKPADPHMYYEKPVVLLTRNRTGSMAENFCMGFRIMKRGKIIGEPTSGSSGTPLKFGLPGGGSAKVVTTRGMFPNGNEFIGIGIEPDIYVTRSIDDVRNGYDRILETAYIYLTEELIKNK
jgi:C-terminal processing protease CtpA/Prc